MKNISIIVSILLLASVSFAETLSWEECTQQALKNNYDLKVAKEQLKQAEFVVAITDSEDSLNVGADASYRLSGDDNNETDDKQAASLGLSARKSLYDGNYNNLAVKQSQEKLTAERNNYRITEANIRLTLNTYFNEALRTQQLISLTQANVKSRRQQFELVKLRYNSGLEHKGSLLTAKANLKNAELELKKAQRSLSLNYQKLKHAMGDTSLEQISVTGNLHLTIDLTKSPDLAAIVKDNPLLKEVVSQRIQDQYSVEMVKSNYLPEAYFSSSLSNSSINSAGETIDSNTWSAGININFNLYNGLKTGKELEIAQSQLKQSQIAVLKNIDSIKLTLREKWIALQDAYENIAVSQEFLAARQERSTIAGAQYTSGILTFDDWIIIEDDLITSQKNYLNSQINALIAEAYWINAQGGGF